MHVSRKGGLIHYLYSVSRKHSGMLLLPTIVTTPNCHGLELEYAEPYPNILKAFLSYQLN